jgi:hypothetical protein
VLSGSCLVWKYAGNFLVIGSGEVFDFFPSDAETVLHRKKRTVRNEYLNLRATHREHPRRWTRAGRVLARAARG